MRLFKRRLGSIEVAESADPSSERSTILVVDGEVLVRHAIADYLRSCGYVVVEGANSDEALAVLEQPNLPVEAILCDVAIAGSLNGFQLVHWVKEHRPELQVILSGNISHAADAAAELCEQGPHVQRPYDPQGVVDYIKRLIAGRERNSG